MLEAARARATSAGAVVAWCQGDARALPFRNASVDLVLAVTALCLVSESLVALNEMSRVLRPGGVLVVGELGRWSLWAVRRRFRGWLGDGSVRSDSGLSGSSRILGASCPEEAIDLSMVAIRPSSRRIDSISRLSTAPPSGNRHFLPSRHFVRVKLVLGGSTNRAFLVQLLHLGSGEFALTLLWLSGLGLRMAGVLSWTISCKGQ